ncbi:MAG: hypothetical protein NWR39_02085 [Pseudomonadota bacterium]|nr:hypothetical protein [Pseudomonadota bacterium]
MAKSKDGRNDLAIGIQFQLRIAIKQITHTLAAASLFDSAPL